MAGIDAISAVSATIAGILTDGFSRSGISNDPLKVKICSARSFIELPQDGISLFMYRLEVCRSNSRQHRVSKDGTLFRQSLPVDLHYLLSSWARDFDKQNQVLGWCMRTLFDSPSVPAGTLNHYSTVPEAFDDSESVELELQTLSLQDLMNIGELTKIAMPASIALKARTVHIDSTIRMPSGAPVRERIFDENITKVEPDGSVN